MWLFRGAKSVVMSFYILQKINEMHVAFWLVYNLMQTIQELYKKLFA